MNVLPSPSRLSDLDRATVERDDLTRGGPPDALPRASPLLRARINGTKTTDN